MKLTCSDARLLLSDLLAGAVEAEERRILDEHLAACAECRRVAEELFRQDLLLLQASASAKVGALADRIHAQLISTAGSRGRGWRRWQLIGLAAAILIGVLLLWPGPAEDSPLVRLDGPGEFFVIDGPAKSAIGSGHKLAAGQTLQTIGDNSQATLRYGDATQLVLGANTTLQLLAAVPESPATAERKIYLSEGALSVHVVKPAADRPMILVTPHAELVVRGTRFWVGTTTEETRVEVEEGAVQFRSKGGDQAVALGAGEQAVAVAPAAGGSPWVERFDSLEHVRPLRGYRGLNPKLELQANDRQEGSAAVRATWTSAPQGFGNGGVEKSFAPADFTGKTFQVWLKAPTPDICGTLAVALFDSRGLRAEVRFVHLSSPGWVKLLMTVGERGKWSSYQRYADADLTRITRIEFYGITRTGNQAGALLVDGFEEVQGR
jgi:ferric-dicitrate binding protein FerR (iron transport regulator)